MKRTIGLTGAMLLCLLTGCGAKGGGPVLGPAVPNIKANANIAFMGDSITYLWQLPTSNLGVGGNPTQLMRERFAKEVLGHGYKFVVILGGTNDMRNLSNSVDSEVTEAAANLEAMAEEAADAKIHVVLCEVPPLIFEDDRIIPLNAAIAFIAKAHSYMLVDYHTPMEGHPEFFKPDGIHPNDQGYSVMQVALTKVLNVEY